MKFVNVSTLSIISALLSWPLIVLGLSYKIADVSPQATAEQIAMGKTASITVLGFGCIFLLFSVWVSGFCFRAEKAKSLMALTIAVLPAIVVFCVITK